MASDPAGCTYLWDFFGPRAAGIAAHFVEHLEEFLVREGFAGCETGTESRGAGHTAAWCRVPPAAPPEVCSGIEKALRPRRVVETPSDDRSEKEER